MALLDNPVTADAARFDGAYRGRRVSWKEFYELRPDLRPANDNEQIENEAGGIAPKSALRIPPRFLPTGGDRRPQEAIA
jgi:hypothetical protein